VHAHASKGGWSTESAEGTPGPGFLSAFLGLEGIQHCPNLILTCCPDQTNTHYRSSCRTIDLAVCWFNRSGSLLKGDWEGLLWCPKAWEGEGGKSK